MRISYIRHGVIGRLLEIRKDHMCCLSGGKTFSCHLTPAVKYSSKKIVKFNLAERQLSRRFEHERRSNVNGHSTEVASVDINMPIR
mmetsp:Transcript_18083/g.37727  ORF Transcript_18083/g.37727 Transcript_18083/m.37727 type:complete len:86 (-) Transcript_18083:1613-1870(-)